MKYKPVRDRCCQNEKCQDHWKFGEGNIIRHSMYKTRQGRRRRYLCKIYETTFCSTKVTPYYRLHKSRLDFDEVVQMTVEGVGISSISRVKRYVWNTIARWQYLSFLQPMVLNPILGPQKNAGMKPGHLQCKLD